MNLSPTLRLVSVAALGLTLSACSMGNMFAPAPSSNAALQNANPTQDEITTASITALPAIATECPPIKVRTGNAALFYYGNGRAGNPQDLQYQAVIDNQSRNCVVSNGLITVKMGVVGRLLIGPKGNQQSVDLPVRFSVERNEVPMFSETYQVSATVNPSTQTGEFVKVVENVAIPYVGGENIVIWVGFDS